MRTIWLEEEVVDMTGGVDLDLLRDETVKVVYELSLSTLHQRQQSILHDQPHHCQKPLQLPEVISHFTSLFHIEPPFPYSLELSLDDRNQLIHPFSLQLVKEFASGCVLNIFEFF